MSGIDGITVHAMRDGHVAGAAHRGLKPRLPVASRHGRAGQEALIASSQVWKHPLTGATFTGEKDSDFSYFKPGMSGSVTQNQKDPR
ncbi:hypothetical protein QSH18_11355 [Xanthomonas sp. NCPPB 2654]|uniref:hypothetical protein n=1 Tax=unclassified Xanthomonas TaxID=2643310 RepID=UPI0021DF9CAD|nr:MULTISPECIES: hypothetical protein [unclassified Xanthomonas]MDL5366203.1 hypothetical protein [Xanthomonas sp. NCPPB 2654]UYC19007.1 hypothetical protein NUG20_12445 [Xanthomonas sp. CFBP 8443]